MARSSPWLAVAAVLAFIVGLCQQHRDVSAAVASPPPCPKYECKTFHAYWAGTPRVWAYFAAVAAPGVGAVSDHASPIPIFTLGSNESLPTIPNQGAIDMLSFGACDPFCGFDRGNRKWQSPQQVGELGANNPNFEVRNFQRSVCTQLEAGQTGPLAENQNNDPDPGVPPGR